MDAATSRGTSSDGPSRKTARTCSLCRPSDGAALLRLVPRVVVSRHVKVPNAMTALKPHFLKAQFHYLLRTYPLRRTWRHKLLTFAETVQLPLEYAWLR